MDIYGTQTLTEQKILHAALGFAFRAEIPDDDFDWWRNSKSVDQLINLHHNHLTLEAETLLEMPLSKWTIAELKRLARDPDDLPYNQRRGCYLIVAYQQKDNVDLWVELYCGSSMDMAKRYKQHKALAGALHFYRRIKALIGWHDAGDHLTFLIPLSCEPDDDQEALNFDESCHIAAFGLWQKENVPRSRLAAWNVVERMKLNKNDRLPPGWNGANCEIPFNPTRGRRKSRL